MGNTVLSCCFISWWDNCLMAFQLSKTFKFKLNGWLNSFDHLNY